MKKILKKHYFLVTALVILSNFFQVEMVKGQAAIIALLFGDKVASEKFNISMEGGLTFPYFANVPNTGRSKAGINFGIAGNLNIAKNWYFSPNIYFLATRNVQFKSFSPETGDPGLDAAFQDVPTEAILRYIDVPVFFFYEANNKKFRYGLAPQISFFQKANAIFKGEYGNLSKGFNSYVNKLDYGIVADLCYVLGKAHKGKGIHIHARYYQGFADIFKDKLSSDMNRMGYFSLHLSLPFITEELAAKNLQDSEK